MQVAMSSGSTRFGLLEQVHGFRTQNVSKCVPGLFAGPFKELDGSLVPPAYFKAYVASTPLLLSVIAPAAAFAYLLWQHELHQGVSTLGVYLIELVAQLISESVYVKQGKGLRTQLPPFWQSRKHC